MAETVETAIYRLRVEGQEQLGKLKADLDGVTVSEEKATKATRTTTEALERRLARLDPVIRAQQQYARELQAATRFAESGVGSDAQRSAQIDLATQRYNAQVSALQKAGQATQSFANDNRLARHEMINLSRQVQDVGVSLFSGQSPLTVLFQQGSQIADVFASSGGTVRGFASQVVSSLGSVLTVGRLAFGGIAAGAATAALALSNYLDTQRDVQRGLIGAGRLSGASAGDINQIAGRAASPTGFSVSEAREVALEFAKTGQIHKRVIGEMIETTHNFSIISGQSAREAAQALGKAFTSMGALDALNEQFRFLDGSSRSAIERLLMFGRTTEAAALANEKLNAVLSAVPGTLSQTEKGWTAVTNAISNYWNALGELIARQANLKPLNTDEMLSKLQSDLERVRSIREDLAQRGRSTEGADAAISRMTAEIERLTAAKAKLGQGQEFNKISTDATAAALAINPLTMQIQQAEAALAKLNAARQAGLNIPGLQQVTQIETQKLESLRQQDAVVTQLLAKYPGMSVETAKQLENLNAQNATLGDLSDSEKLVTQELARQVELRLQGKTALEASAIAAAERANAETLLAAREEAEAEERAAAATAQRAQSAAQAAVSNERAAAAAEAQARAFQQATRFLPGSAAGGSLGSYTMGQDVFQGSNGEYTQFNPSGYQSSSSSGFSASPQRFDSFFGAGNFDVRSFMGFQYATPNQQYRDSQIRRADPQLRQQNEQLAASRYVDSSLASSGVEATITSIINGALGSIMGPNAQQYIGALSGLVPQDRQESVLEQYIARVQQEPVTLARETLLKQLTESLDQLKDSVDSLGDVFSPFYSQDPRRSNLGFRTFAGGGIMTQFGEVPLRKYDGGGIATSPQLAMFGEGSTPEAYVPVPSGRIPVEMRMPANNNQRPIQVNITVNGNTDANTVNALKKTGFQQAQELRRMVN